MEAFSHLGSNQLIVSGEERAGEVDQNRFVARVPPHRTQPAGPHFTHNNLNTGESLGDNLSADWCVHECFFLDHAWWMIPGRLGHLIQGSFHSGMFRTRDALQRQNDENVKQIFPEKEYWGLSPNFHIHVSVSELYIPTMGLPILLEEICGPILLGQSLTDKRMWKLGLRPCNSQKRNT
jgi:hypothetical protein